MIPTTDNPTAYWDWIEWALALPWFDIADEGPNDLTAIDDWTVETLHAALNGHWIAEDAWVAPCPSCGVRGALAVRNVDDEGVLAAAVVCMSTSACTLERIVQILEDRADSWIYCIQPWPEAEVLDALVVEVREVRAEIGAMLTDADGPLPEFYTRVESIEPMEPKTVAEHVEAYMAAGGIEPEGMLGVMSLDDALEQPDPDWYIPNLFAEDSLAIVGGAPGTGKSFLLIDMAACIANGIDWHGHEVRQGKVLYVAAEGERGLAKRIRAWEHDRGVKINRDQFLLSTDMINLSDPKSVERVARRVAWSGAKFIVLDTLAQVAGIENENDAAQIGRALNAAREIRKSSPGSTVVLVHHTNKSGRGLRGSSALDGNVDTIAILNRTGKSTMLTTEPEHGAKIKDGEPGKWTGITLRAVTVPGHQSSAVIDMTGAAPSAPRAAVMSDEDTVLSLLMSGPKTVSQLTGGNDAMRKRLKRSVLPSLVDAGRILEDDSAAVTTYRLP